MKPLPKRNRHQSAAFSLVELLVTMAVLTVMLLLLTEITGVVNKAFLDGIGRVDNFTKSRAILDLVASDVEHAVIRPDLPIFQTGGTLQTNNATGFTGGTYAPSLFTLVAGVPGSSGVSVRNLSFVTYAITTNSSSQGSDKIMLQRSDLAIPWQNGAALIPFQGDLKNVSGATAREVSPGVVGFQLSFRRMDGTVSTSYTGKDANAVVAVGITLAVVGDQVLRKLSPSQIGRLKTQIFAAATPVSATPIAGVKMLWEAQLTPSVYADYPKDLPTNLKIFERWVTPSRPF